MSLLLSGCSKTSKPVYTIGVDPAFYSIESVGREKNILAYLTDVLSEISMQSKMQISIKAVNWNTLYQGLQENQYQAIFSGLPPYNFNQSQYDFSSLVLATGPVLITKKDAKYSSLAKLTFKEVGILSDSKAVEEVEKYPEILIRNYESIPKMLTDLSNNKIEGAVAAYLPAQGYCSDLFEGILEIRGSPLIDIGLRFITLKDKNKELFETVNKHLEKMSNDGSLKKLKAKWGLPN